MNGRDYNPNGLYRARDGLFFGVCKGLANYTGFSVFWLRVIWVLAALLPVVTLPLMIILYLVLALMMKPEPIVPFSTESDREFYDSYTRGPDLALQRLRRTYDHLDRRIQRMESIVTSKSYRWEQRLGGR